ncbi:aminoglycoside N(3)-acetyltransferase [Amycolatopsis jejuensis]|uniref:aminoglycoside N(3)-acetyltransferase n=1 Tax=Amycolatopsis jejuensis TaxID=330084 RepID=UPI001B800ADC|nr:AAC(3) family N-acetyltransferase [Amycolatopsis jejuensis]
MSFRNEKVDADLLFEGLRDLGVSNGANLIVHSSLSAFGEVAGGAEAVVRSLMRAVGASGTVVVPTFTGQVADPHPDSRTTGDRRVDLARRQVPLFHKDLPTPMGKIPNTVLAWSGRHRSHHPQVSVAALGAHALDVTRRQPLAYAVGKGSPFDWLHHHDAQILLLGVGHNRNSFLHYAESLIPNHRRKLRRFPYLVEQQRVWVEADDVGDDNGRFFPRVGAEFGELGNIKRSVIGRATCELIDSVSFVEFASKRLEELLS